MAGAYTPLMRDPEEIGFIILRTREHGDGDGKSKSACVLSVFWLWPLRFLPGA